MDPRYAWPPQAYTNGQYRPYTPSQQQPNGYQQNGYLPQYPAPQMQTPVSQGYTQSSPFQGPHPGGHPRSLSQQYSPMPQAYAQQLPRPRAQLQVVTTPRNSSYASPMQMQPPKIRHVQMPVQRASNVGIAQSDGAHDSRSSNPQQTSTPSTLKELQRSQSHQENGPRPQQRPSNPAPQNQQQHRTPLQQQSTPQQRVPALSQTPSSQHRSPSIQSKAARVKTHPKVVIPRSSSHHLTPTKHAHAPQKALPADLSIMLLTAADEYIAAARGMASLVVRDKEEADLRQYYKLMSTGMGCMDTVLKEFNMVPRDEAKLRLRYASLLIEETNNTSEIDEVLSKQISLCGRSRLQDLKYASFHLQARYQFKTNHRAALKALDKPISEAETFQHIAWIYAFRFLKVSLALQVKGRIEAVSALQQLHAILAHAERHGDRAIYVACSALEAMVHLRSSAPDRIEQAQRAIAAARSLQLQVSAKQLGSFGTLVDVIDIACGIQRGTPDGKKSVALIEATVDSSSDTLRSENGVFTVLVERSFGGSLTHDTGGIFRRNSDGRDELAFAWLPKEDIKMLCFHISALDQNIHEKGLAYAREAHSQSRSALEHHASYLMPISIAVSQTDWIKVLDWHALFTIGLIACFRDDHVLAKKALTILKQRVTTPPHDSQETYTQTLSYLSAIFDQSNGDLNSAMAIYTSDIFELPDKPASVNLKSDIGALAALNQLLIIRSPDHPQHNAADSIKLQLQPFCENHTNQYIRMAYSLIHAMSSQNASINRQKTLVQGASIKANAVYASTGNREFVIMALCHFTKSYFADQVGEKAIQAVRAVRSNAKLRSKTLWMAVALGLCMGTYRRNGMVEEAQEARQEYEEVQPLLPLALGGTGVIDAKGKDKAE